MQNNPDQTGLPRFWQLLLLAALHFASLAAMLLSARWIVSLGGSKSVLGWFSASILPGLVLGAPLAGRLARQVAEKKLILCGAALVGGSFLALSQCSSLSGWLMLWRFMQGFGHGMVFACIFSLAAHSVPDGKKAQGIGYVALTIQMGNLAGFSFAEWLLLHSDFSGMYLGAAALSGLAMLCALGLPSVVIRPVLAGGNEQAGQRLIPAKGQILRAVGFFFILGGSYGTVLQLIPLLVQEVGRTTGTKAVAAPVMAAIFITVALSRLLLARLADGRHQRTVLIGFMALLLMATLAWPLAATMPQMIVVAILFALGYGLLFPGLNGLVLSHVALEWRSRASGWVVMAFDGGFFGLLLLLGPVAELYGYCTAFLLLMGLQLLTGLIFLKMASAQQKKV